MPVRRLYQRGAAGLYSVGKAVGATFKRQFQNCEDRIIVTTFASNVHRIQQVLDAAAQCGRKVAVTGRSMENMMKVSTELGYMKVPKNTLVDINKLKGLPKNKQVIVTTGSQGEEMSALYRMAFSTHKQVEIGAGDKVILSASAVPGNEVTVGRVINELFRKGATVIYDRADMLHVSGHACQEELKIIHALTKPRFFVPLHGEQRMLQIHCQLAQQMGMDRNHIAIADNGGVIEITGKSMKLSANSVPAGEVYVDGSGVGDVGAVVMRDRKRLAEDGMVVVVLPIATQDGALLSPPEIITRGFIYVKESGDLMKELQNVAMNAADSVTGSRKRGRDDGELRGAVKSAVSSYLFKNTKRSPMASRALAQQLYIHRFPLHMVDGNVTAMGTESRPHLFLHRRFNPLQIAHIRSSRVLLFAQYTTLPRKRPRKILKIPLDISRQLYILCMYSTNGGLPWNSLSETTVASLSTIRSAGRSRPRSSPALCRRGTRCPPSVGWPRT